LPARVVALGADVFLAGAFATTAAMLASGLGLDRLRDVFERMRLEPDMLPDDDRARYASASTAFLVASAAAPLLFAWFTSRRAASPGKALLSLTVRDYATGAPPGFGRALARESIRFVHAPLPFLLPDPRVALLGMFLCLGVVFEALRRAASRTWYDRATRTVVVAPAPTADPAEDRDL
jgi:uncharacterized RDD family membrane protein YckC